jgi:mRNA-degrading endonuclease RelE of RelBE toxin-antitoxin system
MPYRLRYDRRFMHQLGSLPGSVRNVARRQIRSLVDEPRQAQAKELDCHPSHYRLWIQRDYRLVYQVDDEAQVVDLLFIGPKSPDLYERLGLER